MTKMGEKDITNTFVTMETASRVAEDRHRFRKDIKLGNDILKKICSEEMPRRLGLEHSSMCCRL